ncbi:MAG: alpha/beta fold hydrolase [Paracoccaceae bacterium]
MRLIALIILVLLSGCTLRPTLVFAPGNVDDIAQRSVFVSTTRSVEGISFGAERSQAPTYLRIDFSQPPKRVVGESTRATGTPDPQTDFLVTEREVFSGAAAFRADLRRAFQARQSKAREAVIYVHGFNNTFDEGVLRIAQLSKDFNVAGVAVHYSWPSAANPLRYAYDRDGLLIARDGLDALITDVRAAGAKSIVIVAHSLGSMLVMETLRQRAIARPGSVYRDVDGIILISPDIDVVLFRAQAARIGRLPEPFGIFVSRRDRVLSLSARLTGQRNRLGNVRNIEAVADMNVTVVDVTEFSRGAGHFTIGSSPALIQLFGQADNIDAAFRGDSSGRTGLFPGTILTVQNATAIVLSPLIQ